MTRKINAAGTRRLSDPHPWPPSWPLSSAASWRFLSRKPIGHIPGSTGLSACCIKSRGLPGPPELHYSVMRTTARGRGSDMTGIGDRSRSPADDNQSGPGAREQRPRCRDKTTGVHAAGGPRELGGRQLNSTPANRLGDKLTNGRTNRGELAGRWPAGRADRGVLRPPVTAQGPGT